MLRNQATALLRYEEARKAGFVSARMDNNSGSEELDGGFARFKYAEKWLNDALESDPQLAIAHYNIANLYMKKARTTRTAAATRQG